MNNTLVNFEPVYPSLHAQFSVGVNTLHDISANRQRFDGAIAIAPTKNRLKISN